jgi:flagellar hook-associated protein 2
MGTSLSTSGAVSFQGLATGIQTDALVSAILAQDGVGVTRMQAQETQNKAAASALTTMQTQLNTVMVDLSSIQDAFNAQTVSSTNSNYVSATATGAVAGNYTVSVSKVATAGRISASLDSSGNPTSLAVADPTQSIVSGGDGSATFAIQGTDGVIKTISLTSANNSLNGLVAAINGSGAGVTASIVNTGAGTKPYQLVLTANSTGTGATNGVVTIADVTNQTTDGNGNAVAGAAVNTLGITAGTTDGQTSISGLTSNDTGATGQNAVFTLNGIQLTRQTNTVTDAVSGMTFNLLQGGEGTGTTTLTVAPNLTAATTAMQTLVTDYNTLLTTYQTASTSTENSDGTINAAPLSGNATASGIMTQIQLAVSGVSSWATDTSAYTNLSNLGVSTNSDGTLSLSTSTFQQALGSNPAAALKLFTATGGVGQNLSSLISQNTAPSGTIAQALASITTQDNYLDTQILSGQAILAQRKITLENQFSQMESTVGSMKAAVGSLLGS